MKKLFICAICFMLLLSAGCMTVIEPLYTPTIKPTTPPPTASPTPSPTPTPTLLPLVGVKISGCAEGILFETVNSASFVYKDCDGYTEYLAMQYADGFLPVPQSNIITGTDGRDIVIAVVDNSNRILRYGYYEYIPGYRYYDMNYQAVIEPESTEEPDVTTEPDATSEPDEPATETKSSDQFISLMQTVTNTNKALYTYGYGEPVIGYLESESRLGGICAGINVYYGENQPVYCPVNGTVLRVGGSDAYNEVAIYCADLDMTFIVLFITDNSPAKTLLEDGGTVSKGALLGYSGKCNGTVSGVCELHFELLHGSPDTFVYYGDEATVRSISYDPLLAAQEEALLDESKAPYIPTNITSGSSYGKCAAAQENGWIYYLNSADADRIYKMRLDGSEDQRVSSNKGRYIAVCEGWIYYSNLSKSRYFYKMRIDGTENTQLLSVSTQGYTIVGDTVYFSNKTRGDKLYSCTTAGKNATAISTGRVLSYYRCNGVLYGCNYGDKNRLYSTQTSTDSEGNVTQKFARFAGIKASYVVAGKDRLFFADYSDKSNTLCSVDFNGENKQVIADVAAEQINVYNDALYFINTTDSGCIYTVNTDGTGLAPVVNTAYCNDLCIAAHYMYYTVLTDGTEITYRYNILTGENVKLKKP